MLPAGLFWEDTHRRNSETGLCERVPGTSNAGRRMTAMLEMPALRVGDQEIAEDLDTRHRFEFFRIDEVGVERERVGVAEQLHQPAVLLHQIIRQHGDAEAALAGAQHAEHIVDGQMRVARTLCRRG